MNTKYLAAIAAALTVGAVSPAFAGDCNGPGDDNCGTSSSQGQVQGQQQGQQQGQAQGQQQGQSLNNANTNVNVNANANKNVNKNENNAVAVSGSNSESAALAKNKNSQDVTINQTTVNPSDITMRAAPAIGVPGPASGPCNGTSATFGISVIGGAGGIGYSGVDEGCEERELARMLSLSGRNDLALDVLQNTAAYKRVQERKQAAAKKAEAEKAEQLAAEQRRQKQAAAAKSSGVSPASAGNADLSDPYIRARLGAK